MKKITFFFVMMLSFLSALTANAQKEVYAEFVASTGTLTYYYDEKRANRTGVTTDSYDGGYWGYDFDCDAVRKAVIDPSMKEAPLTSTYYMFASMTKMTTIEGLKNLNTANVETMEGMFNDCYSLKTLDLGSFNTAKVTNMYSMFLGCQSLTSLDLSSFNTANVTDMTAMFHRCPNLQTLNLSSFNTTNVTNMEAMFDYCTNLQTLDLCSFNTANVTNMHAMFGECQSLTSLDVSSFNTANVTDMSGMFFECKSLPSLDLSSFNTSKVKRMTAMFDCCTNLQTLDLCSFNTANVTDMNNMFAECHSLTTIWCDNDWSLSPKLEESDYMFGECPALVGGKGTKYDEAHTDATYARPDGGPNKPGYFTRKGEVYTEFVEETGTLTYYYDLQRMQRTGVTELYDPVGNPEAIRFTGYYNKITKAVIDPSMKDAPLTSTVNMFYGGMDSETFSIQNLSKMMSIEGLENLNTASVTDMSDMFVMCSSLTSLNLSTFNTSNVTKMNGMFMACDNLQTVDVSSFNTASVTDFRYMFSACGKLTTIFCKDDWSGTEAQSGLMFFDCKSLVGGSGTTYNEDFKDATYARLDGGPNKPGYFTKREVYTEFAEGTGTLTYYYDENRATRTGVTELYDPVDNPEAIRFTGYYNKITKAVIDPSMKDAPLTSTVNMFYGGVDSETFSIQNLSKMMSIEGLENLNTASVTDMSDMFVMCSSLTSLNLSTFNTSNVTKMNGMFMACDNLQTVDVSSFNVSKMTDFRYMFSACGKLTTIFCKDDWSGTEAQSGLMFFNCKSLVGGSGTTYNEDFKDATYARPDGGPRAPGYFTIHGDLNRDKKVDIADAVTVLNIMAASEFNAEADLNGDQKIDIADFVTVLNIMARQ